MHSRVHSHLHGSSKPSRILGRLGAAAQWRQKVRPIRLAFKVPSGHYPGGLDQARSSSGSRSQLQKAGAAGLFAAGA